MEEIYYKKILITSGEVPEKEGEYHTDKGLMFYDKKAKWHYSIVDDQGDECWEYNQRVSYWLKETFIPSPKQEALDFLIWIEDMGWRRHLTIPYIYTKYVLLGIVQCSISELYDKFKEKGEK